MLDDKYITFLYSQKTLDHEYNINKKMNRLYVPKKVLYNGKWEIFTHQTSDPDLIQNIISDAIIIARIKESEVKIMK